MIGSPPRRCPIINYDPEYADTPKGRLEKFELARRNCPVAWSEHHGGFWLVSRYQECSAILRDSKRFSTKKYRDQKTGEWVGGNAIPKVPWDRLIPNEVESPEWNRYRDALNPFFTAMAVDARRERTRAFTDALIDLSVEAGRIDVVTDVGNPLSAVAIMTLLGLPLKDWRRWAEPFHHLIYAEKDSRQFQKAMDDLAWIYQQVRAQIVLERRRLGNEMIGALIQLEPDGGPFSDDELVEMCMQILAGGIETTTALTSNTLYFLHQNPTVRATLQADRALIPRAFEEFVRYFTPIQGLARTATEDVEIDGVTIRKGEMVLLAYASANRDDSVFQNPNDIDIARLPNRHLAFGRGRHFCLGSLQGRMMFEAVLNSVFDRIPDYRVVETEAQRYPRSGQINGWAKLPVEFQPSKKIGAILEY